MGCMWRNQIIFGNNVAAWNHSTDTLTIKLYRWKQTAF